MSIGKRRVFCVNACDKENLVNHIFLGQFYEFPFFRYILDYRLEYFSVMFNILLILIYLFTDGLRLICWHIPEKEDYAFRICVTLKLLLWSFVFLNLLPFNFLIPTLYGRKFYLWLNCFFLLWYGSCVWNSVSSIVYHSLTIHLPSANWTSTKVDFILLKM